MEENLQNGTTDNTNKAQAENEPSVEELLTELAQEKANSAKMKNYFDKASSEAAEYKRQLRAKQTAEEQEADAKREAEEQTKAYIAELENYKRKAEAKNRYISVVGMDSELAEKAAEAEVSGDYDALAELQKQHNDFQRKSWEAEFLKNRPAVNFGNGSSITKEEILAVKDHDERRKLIAQNIHLFN